jgi:hypothetical protein
MQTWYFQCGDKAVLSRNKAAANTLMKMLSYAIICIMLSLTSNIYADVLVA